MGALLVRGTMGSAGSHAFGAIMALALNLVLARILNVSEYGYYVFALAWVMVLAQLCRLGFHNSLIRFAASYRSASDWPGLRGLVIRSTEIVVGVSVITGMGLAGMAILLSERLPDGQVQALVVGGVVVVPTALAGVTQAALKAYRSPGLGILSESALRPALVLLLVLIITVTVGIDTAATAMGVTLIAATGVLVISRKWVDTRIGPDVRGVEPEYRTYHWLRASLPMLMMASMQMVMRQSDVIMLGALESTDAAGLYYPAARISQLGGFGLLSVSAIVASLISEYHTRGDYRQLQRVLTMAAIGTSAVTGVAVLGLFVGGKELLGLFGQPYVAAFPVLMILLSGQVANALCGPVGFLMAMTGNQDRAFVIVTLGACLNVTLNFVLIPQYGPVGAAAATAISTIFWNVTMLIDAVRKCGVNPSIFTRGRALRYY